MKWSAEAKVGLVTIVGVLVFTYVVINLAHAEIFGKPGYVIHAMFRDANGLQKGNSVRYVGVHVGKVTDVTPSKNGVDVAMKIDKGTEIPKGSKLAITTDGLLGEKIISITPGKDSTQLVADGEYLNGNDGKTMDDMMESTGKLVASANDMINNINSVIGHPDTQKAMRGTFQNIEGMTGRVNGLMDANAGNIQEMTAHMASVTASLDAAAAQLAAMNSDGAISENVRDTAANMKRITDSFEQTALAVQKITTDEQSQKDLQKTLHNTAEISGKLNKVLGGGGGLKTEGDANILYNDSKSETGAAVNFRVYRNHTFGLLGAENIGNGTKMNFQYGFRHPGFDIRAGLIRGELGMGLDFFQDKPFRLSLEGYDPDDWRYRLEAKYRLTDNVFLFGQFTRPMNRSDGGNYYGIDYVF